MEERKKEGWTEGTRKDGRTRERKGSSYTCPETLSPKRTCNGMTSKQVSKAPVFIHCSLQIQACLPLSQWSPSHKSYLHFYGKFSKTSWQLKKNNCSLVHRFLCAICWHQPRVDPCNIAAQSGAVPKESGPNFKQYIFFVHCGKEALHEVSFYTDQWKVVNGLPRW